MRLQAVGHVPTVKDKWYTAIQAFSASDHNSENASKESSAVLCPQMFVSKTVFSELRYLRSVSATAGVGFGVLGGNIGGWCLVFNSRGGVDNLIEFEGSGVGTEEMYAASNVICRCARNISRSCGGFWVSRVGKLVRWGSLTVK